MSYADQVFMQNIREILDHGVWDTDQNVRPHWEDGTPAHTIKKIRHRQPLRSAKGVPHPDPPPDLLENSCGRAAVDLAEKVQQRP